MSIEDLGSELCLFRPDINEVLLLNHSAADVVRLSDGSLSVGSLVAQLAQAYGITSEELIHDVHQVIADLTGRGYLVEAGSAASATG